MGKIEARKKADGSFSYRVYIRKKGVDTSKTFSNKEDAELYEFYRERLIENMSNFAVPIKERLTIPQIIELKLTDFSLSEKKTIQDFRSTTRYFSQLVPEDKFIHEITYDDWLEIAKKLLATDVFKGAQTEKGKRKMSPMTLKRIFAYMSSAISYANEKGTQIENIPLQIIRSYINPLIQKENSNENKKDPL